LIVGLESGYAEGRLIAYEGPFMNVKPLLICSLVTLAAAAGCFVVTDKPADSAPPPPPSVATAAPTNTAVPTTTAAPTTPPPEGVAPSLKAAPHKADAGPVGTGGTGG
jgi:hypothetical protein